MEIFRQKKGQGATEYLLMLAAVLVIVAVAIYYIMGTSPSGIVTGQATLDSSNDVVFTPSNTMTPATIVTTDYEWAVYDGATLKGSDSTPSDNLTAGLPVTLDLANDDGASGYIVKIKYGGSWSDAATVA